MTSGVAPRASEACTLRMDSKPTTLVEFAEGESDEDAGDDVTPEQNAEHIQYLVDCVERLTEQIDTLSGGPQQEDANRGDASNEPGYTPEEETRMTERMFQ